MQLEVIGINDGFWGGSPKAQKVDSQDRSRDRSAWDQSGTSPGSGTASAYLQSAKTGFGPRTSPSTGPHNGPGTGPGTSRSQDRVRWYRIPLQTAAETRCHLKQLQTPVSPTVAVSGLAPVFQDRTASQVPVPPCNRLRGTDGLVSRTSST